MKGDLEYEKEKSSKAKQKGRKVKKSFFRGRVEREEGGREKKGKEMALYRRRGIKDVKKKCKNRCASYLLIHCLFLVRVGANNPLKMSRTPRKGAAQKRNKNREREGERR